MVTFAVELHGLHVRRLQQGWFISVPQPDSDGEQLTSKAKLVDVVAAVLAVEIAVGNAPPDDPPGA